MKVLRIDYDVTGLTDEQIEALRLEAVVQAEASDEEEGHAGHPDVRVLSSDVVTFPG